MSAIDLSRETLISVAQAARRLPSSRLDRPVSPSCVWRWIARGYRLADGRVVRLEGVRVCGRWLTSAEALARFFAAQTPPPDNAVPTHAPRTPTARRRASERAAAKLDKLGI
jgi:hypothetical protein